MKKKLFSFVLLIIALLTAAMPAYADAIWEPDNSFYQKHFEECSYVGRICELAGYDGSVTIWNAPNGTADGKQPNGTQGQVQFTWTDGNVIWGYLYGLGGSVDDGWVPMDDVTLVYDSEEFFKDHKTEITETDRIAVDFHSAVLYRYPGGPAEGTLEEDADYMTFSESFSAVYTDANGLRWGYIAYYMGIRDTWVCLDDPTNEHLDTAVVPAEPSQAQLRGSNTVTPGVWQLSSPLLAGALVILVIIVTALMIRRLYPKKKRSSNCKLILSSIVILLPILFGLVMWDKLPDTMTTHWGADGKADGSGTKFFTVFALPVMLWITHLICLYFTTKDNSCRNQNPKALNIIYWIAPLISLFSNGLVYASAFGWIFDLFMLIPASLGILFVFIGNYLPKIRQNRTLGIRIPWTLRNEENWDKTHRLGGKVWVICGLISLFSIFLPRAARMSVAACTMIAAAVIPIIYSYCIYKRHQKEGIVYVSTPDSKREKLAVAIILAATAFFFLVISVTGHIEVHCGDSSFQIEATYWADIEVEYSEIDSIVCRDDFDKGTRTNGFGSPRLSIGTFRNDEFGSYTLYAYTEAEGYIVMEIGKKMLVIGMKDADETLKIYQSLLAKVSAAARAPNAASQRPCGLGVPQQ